MASSSRDKSGASGDAFGQLCAILKGYDKLRPGSFISPQGEDASSDEIVILSNISVPPRLSLDAPEEQLLQAIRRRRHASEDVELGKYLDSTLENIPGAPDGLVRGGVYDKALGEAGDDTSIEKFLVMRLEKDTELTNCREIECCPKIECWAARLGFVNVVMALIRSRSGGQSEPDESDASVSLGDESPGGLLKKEFLLAIAVEYGHVELVQRLIEMPEVDVNSGILFNHDWEDRRVTDDHRSHVWYYEPIESAARMGNVEMVNTLLACGRITMRLEVPLHHAAGRGHLQLVKALLNSGTTQDLDVNELEFMPVDNSLNRSYGYFFTPLHLASFFGHTSVVKALCEDPKGRLRPNTENYRGVTALQIATERHHTEILKVLLERPEVEKYEAALFKDRQAHVDAANAILVGAALIASVAFAGWLQPPLGYSLRVLSVPWEYKP